jgi:undecaprenyl-diphosphatase
LTESPRLHLDQAVLLGALHGPAELLPISSSGHVTLVPWLLGWDYGELTPELRKAFEVALHAGTAAALLIALREDVGEALTDASPRLAMLIGLSFAPPAAAGYLLEGPIERRLGRPGSIAVGLLIGSAAMVLADRAPQRRGEGEATAVDALWLGLAQATALMPGVSRGGATLAAARARGFTRDESGRLSSHVALPIIAAASGLKLVRIRGRLPPQMRLPFAAGAASAFASTLSSAWLIARLQRGRSLLPYAAYRTALAAVVLGRLRKGRPMPLRSARSRTMQT